MHFNLVKYNIIPLWTKRSIVFWKAAVLKKKKRKKEKNLLLWTSKKFESPVRYLGKEAEHDSGVQTGNPE